jgi:hypothetical protein
MEEQLALASRVLQLAERCRQLEGEEEKTLPVPIPDVAAGENGGAVAAPTGALGMTMARGTGTLQVPTSPTAAAAAAGAAAMTVGALVPPELTAARHGFAPKVDGVTGTATTLTATGMRAAVAPARGDGEAPSAAEDDAGAATAATDAEAEAAAALESALMRETLESGELDALDLFWRRLNRALLDKLLMERRREALAAENAQLKAVLSQYLDGLTVGDATLGAPEGNPLLVVNGRTGIVPGRAFGASAQRPRPRGGADGGGSPQMAPPLVVEATTVVRSYVMAQGGGGRR